MGKRGQGKKRELYLYFFCVEKEDGSSGRGMGVGMDWTNLAQDRDR